ncbi:lysosomal alpha-mannosidase, partial [Dendroctonus ponderosae]|uniref:lysosomal alpha-mannosidase n=1 Tax=Dendroctonus ponderosae TaxID=77166 RepID=UPI002035B0FE
SFKNLLLLNIGELIYYSIGENEASNWLNACTISDFRVLLCGSCSRRSRGDKLWISAKSLVYSAGVIYIYDNVLSAVRRRKDRRFIYVETAFFWKWWQDQEESDRQVLRELINNGQIEFTGGGWSMNDEAVTNYQSIIDQMSWGLKRLNDTFGECGRPKMGWQIDPFGHSSEMASIFARLGYDGIILGRIDYEDQANRIANRTMEMVWRGSTNLGTSTDIFSSVLYDHYDAPRGFCFDILCDDDPLIDDLESPHYNIEAKAEEFILKHVQSRVGSFQTSNIMVPMGRDFAYQQAEAWFANIDRLIKYVNEKEVFNHTKYHLFYSTPSCYAAAVQQESAGLISAPLKTDDFLPYASDSHSFWTGFYTSRPTLKRFEREANGFLQACKQLFSLANLPSELEPKLNRLREAMGVMQHHDAITGTEKQVVASDYARLLHMGITQCEDVTFQALSKFSKIDAGDFQRCQLLNISECALSEQAERLTITVYNPLSRKVNKYIRVPVMGSAYSVTDPEGQNVASQLVPIAAGVQGIIGRNSSASVELVFQAEALPPLGFKSFFIKRELGDTLTREDAFLQFDYSNQQGVGFSIDEATGLVSSLQMNSVKLDIDQRFWYYNGSNGWIDEPGSKPSGAYLFRPDPYFPISKVSDTATFEVYRGDVVTEIHQSFSEIATQVIRLYANEKHVEFDWVAGPMEIESQHGRELISRFTTPLKSDSKFFTDSNGREMVERVRNYRPTWDVTVNETESANYYPVTSRIIIRDEEDDVEFAVLTDRAEGGASLEDGAVELMLLRNTITDDLLGVNEALIELQYGRPIVAKGSHYVVAGHMRNPADSEETIASIEHEIASQKLLDSWIFLSLPLEDTFEEYKTSHLMEFSGLTNSLPANVQILTLEPWSEASYLLRVEHIFEVDEDPVLSQPTTVELQNLFATFTIKSLRETTLGGNQWLEDNERMIFKSLYQSDGLNSRPVAEELGEFAVTLNPMEIRTFIIQIEPKL